MSGSLRILTIRDIKIYVHWSFLLLIAWAVVADTMAGFNATQVAWSVLFLLAVFGCVILHELGHAIVASQYGINAKTIVLYPIGGIASIDKLPETPKQELAISIAGPLVNVLIAMALSVLIVPYEPFWKLRYYTGLVRGDNFVYSLYMVNLFLAAFNLIPAFPLDGGRVLRALLAFKYNFIKATAIAAFIGRVIAWLLIGFGLLTFNPFLPFIGLFIIFFSRSEENYLHLKALVKGIKLKDALMYDYNSLQADMTVQEAGNILVNNHSKYFIVMNGSEAVGSIDRMEIIKAIAEMNYDVQISALMKENLQFFDGEMDVENVLEKLSTHEDRIYPVVENSHFAGVVNFQHIIEYILLHNRNGHDYGKVKSLAAML